MTDWVRLDERVHHLIPGWFRHNPVCWWLEMVLGFPSKGRKRMHRWLRWHNYWGEPPGRPYTDPETGRRAIEMPEVERWVCTFCPKEKPAAGGRGGV